MENKGLLSRVHGGAISSFKPYCSMNFNQRLETNQKEKTKLLKRLQKWQIKNYHADKLILPVDGIDVKKGFTTYYNKESDIDRAIIEQSELHIVAADFFKIWPHGICQYILNRCCRLYRYKHIIESEHI